MNKITNEIVEKWKYKGWRFIKVNGKVYIRVENFQKALDSLKDKLNE